MEAWHGALLPSGVPCLWDPVACGGASLPSRLLCSLSIVGQHSALLPLRPSCLRGPEGYGCTLLPSRLLCLCNQVDQHVAPLPLRSLYLLGTVSQHGALLPSRLSSFWDLARRPGSLKASHLQGEGGSLLLSRPSHLFSLAGWCRALLQYWAPGLQALRLPHSWDMAWHLSPLKATLPLCPGGDASSHLVHPASGALQTGVVPHSHRGCPTLGSAEEDTCVKATPAPGLDTLPSMLSCLWGLGLWG